jgi:hypothetical protein
MLRAMEDATDLPSGSIVPISQKVQLWGAAVPMNRHTAPFVMDGAAGVGVCGDWFTPSSSSTGPSIESAYLSGRFLADAIAERFQSKVIKDHGLELHHSFEACAGHPLGDVPTGANTPSQTGKYINISEADYHSFNLQEIKFLQYKYEISFSLF